MDTRWLVYAIWGVGTTIVWGMVLSDSYGVWKQYRDRRAKRELLSSTGLFLVALGTSLSIALVVFPDTARDFRGVVVAFALGMFTGAGLVRLGMYK